MNEATSEATRDEALAWWAARGLIGVGEYDPATEGFEDYEGVPVGAVIGRNVRRIREERLLTQHELAQLWQRSGLPWARSKVSALEAGSRPQVSVGELVAMAMALRVPLAELFAGPPLGRVTLTPSSVEVAGPALATLFQGGDSSSRVLEAGFDTDTWKLQDQYAKERSGERPVQADVELAQRLGVHPKKVIEAAFELYDGRTLTEERDRRVERMPVKAAAERQAHRGHITRELSKEIERELDRRGKAK